MASRRHQNVSFPALTAVFFTLVCVTEIHAEEGAVGTLEKDRPVTKIGEESSTLKEDSFKVPTQDPETDLTDKEARLQAIQGRLTYDVRNASGSIVRLIAKESGNIDPHLMGNKSEKLEPYIKEVFRKNSAILGSASNYDFRVIDRQYDRNTGYRFVIEQHISGAPISRRSYIDVRSSGDVYHMTLLLADPEFEDFKRDAWMGEDSLLRISVSAWEKKYGPLSMEVSPEKGRYTIYYNEPAESFVPAYELRLGSTHVFVHAITGETLNTYDNTAG